jgi:engulfment/cell motility protein 1
MLMTARKECESTASAIIALKEKLRPEIMAIIREQRLGFLVEGTKFSKFNRGVRSKDKFWYVRLTPNHKVLHYGDCDEKTVPLLEELKSEVRVCDMKQLLENKDCPHVKEIKNRSGMKMNTLFSIVYDDNADTKTLDFVAPDDISFSYWVDGLACLLGQPMTSSQMKEDFETLLSVEIKLRLLDTEGVDISKEAPEIPPEPEVREHGGGSRWHFE